MSAVKTYSPDRVKLVVGVHSVTGYADGTFVSIDPLGDGITSQAGADGEVARVMSADKRVKITLTLQQTSRSNDVLNTLLSIDHLSGGDKPFPLMLTDLRGTTLVATDAAWIVNRPTVEFGKELGNREWVIETARAAFTVGGNN